MSKLSKPSKLSGDTIKKLREVSKTILAEPKRINMHGFGTAVDPDRAEESELYPPCNTKGCIAGWAIFNNRPRLWEKVLNATATSISGKAFIEDFYRPEKMAIRILGISKEQAMRLFYFEDWGFEYKGEYLGWPNKFVSRYNKAKTDKIRAKVTAERIEHFIKTNGAE